MNNEHLQFHTEKKKVRDLILWEDNPRKITDERRLFLEDRLKRYGMIGIPVVDLDNKVIAGHQRIGIYLKISPETEIEVRMPNRKLTEEEFKSVNLLENQSAGEWDWERLDNLYTKDELLDAGFSKAALGILENQPIETDQDVLSHDMETYLGGNIRQIVLYFTIEQFNDVVPRLDSVMQKESVGNHTEAVLRILDFYEKSAP